MTEREQRLLRDFLEFAAAGARLVARGREAYNNDEMLRLAGEAVLHRVGAVVARLDGQGSVTTDHPEVSWRQMKGMRNIVAHEYGVVDHAIIWNALESNLPKEARLVRRILAE